MSEEAEVARVGFLDMQICIPKSWTDEQAKAFAEENNPCGTSHGWEIRKEGSRYIGDSPERVQCEDKEDFVHIALDA